MADTKGTGPARALTAIALWVGCAALAYAQATPPPLLQLQGRLTDNAGQPVTSTSRDLRVEFWDAAVGGTSLGASTVVDPAITNGIYAVTLATPASLFANNATVFTEMSVGNGAAGADGAFEVLAPRTRVLASGYALNADTLDGRDSSFFAQSSNSFVQGGNSFGALATLGTNDGNELALETGGVERVRIDAAGNAGFGVSSPAARIHIRTPGTADQLRIESTSGAPGSRGGIQFFTAFDPTFYTAIISPSDGAPDGGLVLATRPGAAFDAIDDILFKTDDVEKMRIKDTGNVGIGTATPASRLSLGTSGSLANGLTFGPAGTSGIYTDPSGWLILTNQNGVGKLTLFDTYARADENFIVENMLRGSGGNTPLKVDSGLNVLAGNVGIGTATPSLLLHVAGDARVGSLRDQVPSDPAGWGDACVFSGGPVVWGGSGWGSDNSDPLWMARFNQAPNETELRMVIGDDPGQLQDKLVIGTMVGSGVFSKAAAFGPIMTVSANGNVGIGTTTPGARLTVVAGATTDTLGANGASEGFDIAEAISAAADVEVADLVCADRATSQRVVRSRTPYDPALLGVITSQPAIAIGATDGNRHIALAGRVAVKFSHENGPIRRGEYLTSSSRPGYAMKATGPGRVVGVALGECSGEGEGKVVVYVSPGWWDGGRTAELADRVTDLSGRLDRAERENAELRGRMARLEAMVEAKLR